MLPEAEPRVVFALEDELGEGPLWDPEEQALYWLDIYRNRLYRYEPPLADSLQIFQFDTMVTSLAQRRNGGFVLATQKGLCFWDGQALEKITHPEEGKADARFNDSKVDRQGRFWSGTMTTTPDETSKLYRLDPDLSLHTVQHGVGVSNGIGWSPDNTLMYYSDSRKKCIFVYDYELATGKPSNERILVLASEDAGSPDGLTVDSEGFIWAARWGGWKVTRYTPDGRIDREIRVPAEFPTSVMFGDADLKTLYITSARTPLDAAQRQQQPLAGSLFSIRTEQSGLPEPRFNA